MFDLKQARLGHPVQMEGREPWLDPGVARGLLSPYRFLALAQVQVKPSASRLSQQRDRRQIGGIHGLPVPSTPRPAAVQPVTGARV